jgi:hypothetical protein
MFGISVIDFCEDDSDLTRVELGNAQRHQGALKKKGQSTHNYRLDYQC